MAGSRRYIAASDFCASVRDGTHDSPKPVTYGRRLVTSRHLTTGRLDLSEAYLISESDYEAINKRSKVNRWDVLISMIGTVGEPCLIKEEPDFAIKNIGLFKTKSEVDGKWLYYYLRSKEAQQSIRAHSRGTTQQYIPLGALRDFPILVTDDAEEQRAIAHVLGTLDDLIELNRETNEILEEMARALFKSWFVDFDPVRAKLEGRPPSGMYAATAKLFPDHFQDSELGQIPKGWEVSTIGQKLKTILGGTPSRARSEFWTNGSIPWINSGKTNEFRIIEPSEWITAEALEKSATKLLPSRTTVLAITGATLGQVSIAEIECCANQSVVAILASQEFPTEYIYHWIKENIEKLVASQTGGAQQHINKGNVEELFMLCPNQLVVSAFTELVRPMFDAICANLHESSDLAALRDTLLPKLLSGEVSVPAAEELIAATK